MFTNNKQLKGELYLEKKLEADSSGADITSIILKDHNDLINSTLISGKSGSLMINCKAKKHFSNANINIQVGQISHEGDDLLFINSPDDKFYFDIFPGKNIIKMHISCLALGVGEYKMKVLIRQDKGNYIDRVDSFEFLVRLTNY